jgi:hypothetical protein
MAEVWYREFPEFAPSSSHVTFQNPEKAEKVFILLDSGISRNRTKNAIDFTENAHVSSIQNKSYGLFSKAIDLPRICTWRYYSVMATQLCSENIRRTWRRICLIAYWIVRRSIQPRHGGGHTTNSNWMWRTAWHSLRYTSDLSRGWQERDIVAPGITS